MHCTLRDIAHSRIDRWHHEKWDRPRLEVHRLFVQSRVAALIFVLDQAIILLTERLGASHEVGLKGCAMRTSEASFDHAYVVDHPIIE